MGSRVERSKERKDKNRTEITIAGTRQNSEVAGKEKKIGNDGRQERRRKGRKKEGKSKERIRLGRE